ncbi:MAG: hypothetical protein K0R12_445 [Gammaproteobacteria bacterium]|jgi:hypothetical protein|nr:hypothetical protein [Gammaproteobacteria bacterium]
MLTIISEKTDSVPTRSRAAWNTQFKEFSAAINGMPLGTVDEQGTPSIYKKMQDELRDYIRNVEALIKKLGDQPDALQKFIEVQSQFIAVLSPQLVDKNLQQDDTALRELHRNLDEKNNNLFKLLVNLNPPHAAGRPEFRQDKFAVPEKYKLSSSDELEGINPHNILFDRLSFLNEKDFYRDYQFMLSGFNINPAPENFKESHPDLASLVDKKRKTAEAISDPITKKIFEKNIENFVILYLNSSSIIRHILPHSDEETATKKLKSSLVLQEEFDKLKTETDRYVEALKKEGAENKNIGKRHDKFQVAIKLQKSLEGEESMEQKIKNFDMVLKERYPVTTGRYSSLADNKDPRGKEILEHHRDSATVRFLGVVANVLTFGLLSKLIDGKVSLFWSHKETKGSKVTKAAALTNTAVGIPLPTAA